MDRNIRVGLAGPGFGAEFVPIYLHHPRVEHLVVCDSDPAVLQKIGDRFEVAHRTTGLDDLLNDDSLDATHLVSPIPLHAEQTLAVLNAGKHCACTVPMATRLEDLQAIIDAQPLPHSARLRRELQRLRRESHLRMGAFSP